MRKKLKWVSTVLMGLWVLGCSHSPGPATQVVQPPSAAPTQAASTQGVPVMEARETTFDFGEVSEDGDYVHDFKIANKGDGVLQVKNVIAG